jgi:hypothetical protein
LGDDLRRDPRGQPLRRPDRRSARGAHRGQHRGRHRFNAWFPLGRHLIEGLYRTARSIESTARQRESLVTLGTLAAGLAHEINNPAAATRAVDALEAACQSLLSSSGRLAHGDISAHQFAELDALRREIGFYPAAQDPLAVADREDALSSWLARHGVADEWLIAPPLAAAGVDVAWCERAALVLPSAKIAKYWPPSPARWSASACGGR